MLQLKRVISKVWMEKTMQTNNREMGIKLWQYMGKK